jgi:hypothetical protein
MRMINVQVVRAGQKPQRETIFGDDYQSDG